MSYDMLDQVKIEMAEERKLMYLLKSGKTIKEVSKRMNISEEAIESKIIKMLLGAL